MLGVGEIWGAVGPLGGGFALSFIIHSIAWLETEKKGREREKGERGATPIHRQTDKLETKGAKH